ncbi:MAG: UDP-N-acetylmuramate--alanine ligase [Planctomycetota bacterium]|jgi:UDP-N-acetylmuramate--alanine ligase
MHNNIALEHIKKVHCIGIGGIGLSALARMFLRKGAEVAGSDMSMSHVTELLESEGVQVFFGHAKEHVAVDTDVLLYSIAVPDNNPELIVARELGIPMLTYPEALGVVSAGMRVVAISGTHGKTTTTAMTSQVLVDGGADPTVVVGSLLPEYNSNFIPGESDLFVVEACEYRRSFLNIVPSILVILNIEADHLDYYKDLADIQSAFRELIDRMPEDGVVICDPNAPSLMPVLKGISQRIVSYPQYNLTVSLQVPGEYNRNNARAAGSVARVLGLADDIIQSGLVAYRGVWRRFEYKGVTKTGAEVYDDYAHHPTEVQALLLGVSERFPDQKIVAVFESHMYSRTQELLADFGISFTHADEVIVLPIYRARGDTETMITTEDLTNEIKKNHNQVTQLGSFEDAKEYLGEHTKNGDLVITIGAGPVTKLSDMLVG